MNFTWFGHSCFLITTDNGTRILTDPYDDTVGYPMHTVNADIVTLSHDHFDHNHISMATGNPVVCRTAGVHEVNGVRITGMPSYHDDAKGEKRGTNIIFLIETDGLRVAHLGDLGELPGADTLRQLDPLDVLLAPVGGVYTIGPRIAREIANRTHTRVLVPMHYQTDVLTLGKKLHGVGDIISTAKDCSIHKLNQSGFVITADQVGEDRLLVPDYLR